uniref:Uncharacterized protein n=1 Tax=Romanomermis culicivorax TaxID=13658 RepID=A0A915I8H9_ROMCU
MFKRPSTVIYITVVTTSRGPLSTVTSVFMDQAIVEISSGFEKQGNLKFRVVSRFLIKKHD